MRTRQELVNIYHAYIHCLNNQDWVNLSQFVHADAVHNGRVLGVFGYRRMLENDYEMIPDLRFTIDILICDPPYLSSRLVFDCHPKGAFLGIMINGKRARFTENVIYEFSNGKIKYVHSIVDKASLETQFLAPL